MPVAARRAAAVLGGAEPFLLTWHGDPTTTMTVIWLDADGPDRDEVHFAAVGGDTVRSASGRHHSFVEPGIVVRVVELGGLSPASTYRFRYGGGVREHRFRTMPADPTEPVTFVVGGDVFPGELDPAIYRTAAAAEPDFAVLGGDIVYDDGRLDRAERWVTWLDAWSRLMVTPADGCVVPVLAAIGNEDVAGGNDGDPADAPGFYAIFGAALEGSYRAIDFGSYLSVILLDTGHTEPIQGAQTRWLEQTLAARSAAEHLVAVYHQPAFPSVLAFEATYSTWIRTEWVPLFERFGVDLAFEHHDHAYKRTVAIRGGRPSADGIVYFGDGAWGVKPHAVHDPASTWYLAQARSVNHILAVTLDGPSMRVQALDRDGKVIDAFPATNPPVEADRKGRP